MKFSEKGCFLWGKNHCSREGERGNAPEPDQTQFCDGRTAQRVIESRGEEFF